MSCGAYALELECDPANERKILDWNSLVQLSWAQSIPAAHRLSEIWARKAIPLRGLPSDPHLLRVAAGAHKFI
jgi:hypothetical protein